MDDPRPDSPTADDDPGPCSFWAAACARFSKELLLVTLACGFILQTCLVYSDDQDSVALTAHERDGRRIWHRHNCQACHQFHGFGGFLGPDLTNVAQRLQRGDLEPLLVDGREQMPAFALAEPEIDAVWAFLQAMDRTGTGQARAPEALLAARMAGDDAAASGQRTAPTALGAIALHLDDHPDDDVAHGFALFQSRACLSCHVPFAVSAVGAPDLSHSGTTLAPEALRTVLAEGRAPRMPKPALQPDEERAMAAFIEWLAGERRAIIARIEPEPISFWSSLPWWEYH